jgi:signal transduction histidine kinase
MMLVAVLAATIDDRLVDLGALGMAIWTGSSLSAGLLLLCAWRLSGRAVAGHLGVAGVVLGLGPPISLWMVALVSAPHGRAWASVSTLVLMTAIGGRHLLRAGRCADVETELRPGRRLLASAVAAAAATCIGVGVGAAAPQAPDVVLITMTTSAWAALSVAVAVSGAAMGPTVRSAVAVAVGLLAVATASAGGAASGMVRVVAAATASALLAGIAVEVLRLAFQAQGVRSLSVMASLAQYEDEVSRDRQRRHDVRSALAAIRAASATLATSGIHLDVGTRTELAAAVHEEFSRVERLLDPGSVPRSVVADPANLLAPLVTAWHIRGLDVDGPSPGPLARVEPDGLLQIVGNLLDNAHRHAQGAQVHLSSHRDGKHVHLVVADTGPGIPRTRRAEVFVPGVSLDPTTAGSGLGLPSARALAEAQGGALHLVDSTEGCRFVLSLPSGHETSTGDLGAPELRVQG